MKRFCRTILGIPIGICVGYLLLYFLNMLNDSLYSPTWITGLIEQGLSADALGDRVFAWCLLYGLFAIPVIRGVKEGYRENYSILRQLILPFCISLIAVIAMFVVAFILVFIIAFFNLIFDIDSIIGIVAIISLFIAFSTPITKFVLVIFD